MELGFEPGYLTPKPMLSNTVVCTGISCDEGSQEEKVWRGKEDGDTIVFVLM